MSKVILTHLDPKQILHPDDQSQLAWIRNHKGFETLLNKSVVKYQEMFSNVESYRNAMIILNQDLVDLSNGLYDHEYKCDKDKIISRVKKELKMKDSTHMSDRVTNLFKDVTEPNLA